MQMSPTSFSSTISSISVVNQANIPAATAPTATLSKELASSLPHSVRPPSDPTQYHSSDAKRSGASGSGKDSGLDATVSAPGVSPNSPPPKLVKKILLKAPRRVQRVVNLDSDHDDEDGDHHGDENEATIGKKKKSTSKKASASIDTGVTKGDGDTEKKTKKKSTTTSAKKTKKKSHGAVSFADDGPDHHDDDRSVHHVHRSVSLQHSMNAAQANGGGSNHHHPSRHHHPPQHPPHLHDQHDSNDNYNAHLSPDDFSKAHDGAFGSRQNPSSPKLRPSSPFGSCYSSDGEGGAEGYRRKIEAMKNEAGSNWLKVLAEMDNGSDARY